MKSGFGRGSGTVVWILVVAVALAAKTFYIDPRTGSPDGNGSRKRPWSTLQDVIESGKIETREPAAYPYQWGKRLKTKNPGAAVKAGDTLLLRGGRHGAVSIRGACNRWWITIAADSGHHPVVHGIRFWGARKWRVDGLTVCPEGEAAGSREPLVSLASNQHYGEVREIIVENCDIVGSRSYDSWKEMDWASLARTGIDVRGKRNIIRNNRLVAVDFGVSVAGDSNLVEYNSIIHFMSDALRGIGNDLTFQYNYARNCYIINGNHDDGFQSWSRGSDGKVGTGTVCRIKLIGNVIINYASDVLPHAGNIQGIGCFDGMAEDWTIADNIVVVDHWHGITLLGAVNCRIINNTVCSIKNGPPGPPWIRIGRHKNGTPSRGCVVRNNLTTDIKIQDPGSTVLEGNVIFANPDGIFLDFPRFDMRLKPGCRSAGASSDIGARAAKLTDVLQFPVLAQPAD